MLKNSHCSMAISAGRRSKFASLHRQRGRLPNEWKILEWAGKFQTNEQSIAIEPCGSFSVPLLLWYVASVYNGHLRVWHSLLFPIVQHRCCQYIFLRLRSVEAGIRSPILLLARQRSNRLPHRRTERDDRWKCLYSKWTYSRHSYV